MADSACKHQPVGLDLVDVVVVPEHHHRLHLIEPLHIGYNATGKIEMLQIDDEPMEFIPGGFLADDRPASQKPVVALRQTSFAPIGPHQHAASLFEPIEQACVEPLGDPNRVGSGFLERGEGWLVG